MQAKFCLLIFLCTFSKLYAEEIWLEGIYQGKSLYVQNPLTADRAHHCTQGVWVNGVKVLTEPVTSSFEINMARFGLNNPVEIRIVHRSGCEPKVINPSVIEPSKGFQFTEFKVEKNTIEWLAKGEGKSSIYYVERFINNNWSTFKVINNQNKSTGVYRIPVSHSRGVNKYRIKYQELDGQIFYSKVIEYVADNHAVRFYPKNVANKIFFTAEVSYEIRDIKKRVVLQGKGKEIDVGKLQRGVYYLTFDNQTEQFLKK